MLQCNLDVDLGSQWTSVLEPSGKKNLLAKTLEIISA